MLEWAEETILRSPPCSLALEPPPLSVEQPPGSVDSSSMEPVHRQVVALCVVMPSPSEWVSTWTQMRISQPRAPLHLLTTLTMQRTSPHLQDQDMVTVDSISTIGKTHAKVVSNSEVIV